MQETNNEELHLRLPMLQIRAMPRNRLPVWMPMRKIAVLLAALPVLAYGQTSVPT